MTTLQFADTHNMVAFLSKPAKSKGFEQIVDFLNANPIKYALTIIPTIYTSCIEQFWATVKAKTVNEEVQLQALVDRKKVIITESTVRRDLHLEDAKGVDCLPIATIFEQLTLMGYEKLLQKLTFFKAFFSLQRKFLIHTILQCLSVKTTPWNEFSSTMASIFGNIRRVGKGFSRRETPLFQIMVVQHQEEMGKGSANPTDPHHTPIIIQPSTSQSQKKQKPRKPKRKDTEVPQPSGPTNNVADKAVYKEMDDSLERAVTTATSLDAELIDLEKTKTSQAQEIISLKRRVKRLEKKNRSKTHGLKRLMFDVSDLAGEEVFVAEQGVPDSKKDDVVSTADDAAQVSTADDAAQVSTAATTVTTTPEESHWLKHFKN
ncbi:hypothetical protein Tco_0802395 [Tanacetum coccineum]|uniref:Xylulose kinase-1 n=1 Tax=Tanacetum coccineum TaxID=301880 RepID=A0ABQ5A2V4_9ASTR